MRFDATKALITYAGVTTAALAIMLLSGATAAPTRFGTIDVERINVREPDGTLRMILSNSAAAPGIFIRNQEHPHPTRTTAGIIFLNQEGSENGGISFDGRMVDGKPQGGGSLTFDRYEQDQVVQMMAEEDGAKRIAGFNVFDRPDQRFDFAMLDRAKSIPADQRAAFYRKAGVGVAKRVFVGRLPDGSARIGLRDAQGRERLVMAVSDAGAAQITFLDAAGKTTKTLTP